jgi:S1-C subfamily serine protease
MYAEPYKSSSLLMIAILAGMATAAGFVLVQSLHTVHDPLRSSAHGTSIPLDKPSVFGSANRSATPPGSNLSAPQIAKVGARSVVTVTGYDADDKPLAQGPGYVYSASGIIITSYSAIRGASSVTVATASGEELNVIALMGYSPNHELAVLAVLEGNLSVLETGAGDIVNEGDAVTVVGPNNAVSQGAVGPRRAIGGLDLVQITAEAAAGSPVLNAHGKVIGVATHKRVGGQTLTFAIPSHYISDLLADRHVISFGQMLEETQWPATTAATGASRH